ncbi:transglycosylase SLT domain-containing protein [Bradyrhizobium sp. ARR65]|uniref:lytic transglycosylase domain-containing protein n=1 Tax=Bradyrhizobium sp. ARR65 TaxID=1040989 RepID=UPI000AEA3600|nr:transglycosylase SLT domain-containing protein [Bradyrhizobium sp. ARR65]
MAGGTSHSLLMRGARLCSAIALAFVIAAGAARTTFAESAPPESFATRFAAAEMAASAPAAPTVPSPEPPKDVLRSAVAVVTPTPSAADARSHYRSLIEKEAAQNGLAPEIAEAVMAVESGYNPGAVGGAGEIGLMQILPSTARMLGFSGTLADLAVPETNIHYGVTYLAQAWRLAGGDLCTAVMKYRAGHGETRFSFLSVNYCLAVRSKLMARGFPVTGRVPVATFGEPARGGCGRKCVGIARVGQVNLAALNSQLSALVVQVRAGR